IPNRSYSVKLTYSLAVWKDFLYSGDECDIVKWKELKVKSSTLAGHTAHVSHIGACGDFLFSTAYDNTIRKWNEEGNCLMVFQQNARILSLSVCKEELYVFSVDKTLKRWNWDGHLIQHYKPQPDKRFFSQSDLFEDR